MASADGPTNVRRVPARLGEAPILGEEPITRMDGVGPDAEGGADERVARQIALPGRCRTDRHRLVGLGDVWRALVGLGVHGHGREAELATGTDDPAGDFPPVGHQHLAEH